MLDRIFLGFQVIYNFKMLDISIEEKIDFLKNLVHFCCCWCIVHGIEYAFGAHEYPSTGIFEGEPKQCEGFTFRKSILIGKTDLGPLEVRATMEQLADNYKGSSYNLITKNCNHFCDETCIKLTGNPIPSWVNRLARIGKISGNSPHSLHFGLL